MNNELIQISINDVGAYFIYSVVVQRGIRGKTRAKANELLIVGIPLNKLNQYCIEHKYIITNKAVYYGYTKDPILFRKGRKFLYVKENEL